LPRLPSLPIRAADGREPGLVRRDDLRDFFLR